MKSKGLFHEKGINCLSTVGNLLLTGGEDATAILTQISTDEYGSTTGKVAVHLPSTLNPKPETLNPEP